MPSNIPLWTFGVAFRLRLVTFTEQAHRAYMPLGGIPAWRDIHQSHVAPSRDIHRARSPRLQASRWHPRVAKGSSGRSSARRPYPQVPQCHPRVAKGTSIGTLARGPSTEALLGQGRVAKGRKLVPLPGLWSGSRPGLARHPRLQVVLRQGRVTKGTSIGTLARGPCPQCLSGILAEPL